MLDLSEIKETHIAYIDLVEAYVNRAKECIGILNGMGIEDIARIMLIEKFIGHADRQIDQIRRRVIVGESIPHYEKVFSIFEEHTEWISKGKAGVPQELGLRVCILEDQYGFILHHHIMEKETDDKIAVQMVKDAKRKFTNLGSCSFDKGFYTPENKKVLKSYLDKVILPKKGNLSKKDREEEYSEEFINLRRKHSAVESGINALENHGLDRCRNHGIEGFKRYISLSVLSRNIQILGSIIQKKKLKQKKRKQEEKFQLAA
jgi:transposase, IS5 family